MDCMYVNLIASKYDDLKLYKEVLIRNPDVKPEEVNSFYPVNQYDLIIIFKNGDRIYFDTLDNSRRYLPSEKIPLTEEQHRKIFPQLLVTWMKRKSVTQEELANKLNLSQQMISKYISGKAIPGYVRLKKIADVLDITVDDLYLNY